MVNVVNENIKILLVELYRIEYYNKFNCQIINRKLSSAIVRLNVLHNKMYLLKILNNLY